MYEVEDWCHTVSISDTYFKTAPAKVIKKKMKMKFSPPVKKKTSAIAVKKSIIKTVIKKTVAKKKKATGDISPRVMRSKDVYDLRTRNLDVDWKWIADKSGYSSVSSAQRAYKTYVKKYLKK
jgi:hypothetical protein